jgi:hypothetical protein
MHPTISVLIPLVFLMLLGEILRDATGFVIPRAAYLFLLLAALEEVVVGNILFQERVGTIERLREPFYVLAFVGLVLFVMQRGSLTTRAYGLLSLLPLTLGFLTVLQWLLTWRIHNALRDRELLEISLQGKEGTALRNALRDNAEMARLAISAVPRTKRMVIFFQMLAFATVIALFAVGIRVSPFTAILLLLDAMLSMFTLGILNNAAEDQLLSADGVAVGSFYRRRRFVYTLVILGCAFVVVLAYARQTSLLPLEIFRPFLDWLASLFNRERNLAQMPRTPMRVSRPEMQLLQMLEMGPPREQPLIDLLRFLLRVVWNVVKLGLLLVLAYFLISPFFSRAFRARLRSLTPLAFVREQLARMGRFVRRLVDDLLAWLRRPPAEKRRARRGRGKSWRRRLVLRRPGLFKRWEMGKVLRAYVRLIRWAERRGVRFRAPLAPREYMYRVAAEVPDHRVALDQASVILEEAIFSDHRVARARLRVYFDTIRAVTRRHREQTVGE